MRHCSNGTAFPSTFSHLAKYTSHQVNIAIISSVVQNPSQLQDNELSFIAKEEFKHGDTDVIEITVIH